MNNSIKIIQDLIKWLEKYSTESSPEKFDFRNFVVWLNSKVFAGNSMHHTGNDASMIDMELTFLLIMQNKHYKSYSKKALCNSVINSPESFSFLYHLDLVDSYRKMELIKMHLLEPPSGIEVLKRLLKKGLIDEFDDPDDKRAKRIKITDGGRKEVLANLKGMQKVFKTMTAGKTMNEKLHIISALRDINEYHLKHIKNFQIEEE